MRASINHGYLDLTKSLMGACLLLRLGEHWRSLVRMFGVMVLGILCALFVTPARAEPHVMIDTLDQYVGNVFVSGSRPLWLQLDVGVKPVSITSLQFRIPGTNGAVTPKIQVCDVSGVNCETFALQGSFSPGVNAFSGRYEAVAHTQVKVIFACDPCSGVDTGYGIYTKQIQVLGASTPISGYMYSVKVEGDAGPEPAPSFYVQPMSARVSAGGNTTFSVGAYNANAYQWQVDAGSGFVDVANAAPYSDANSSTLVITGASSFMNGYRYRVKASGATSPAALSSEVTLTVLSPPAITAQPSSSAIIVGGNTTFVVGADHATGYQWQVDQGSGFSNIVNGGPYSGATTNTLTITDATLGMSGYLYRVVVSGEVEPNATSNNSILTVSPPWLLTTSAGSAAFTAGDNIPSTPIAVDSGVTLTSQSSRMLDRATVAITGNLHTVEDVLAFTNTSSVLFGNINASYNAATGVLTLTSPGAQASVAQWQAALRAVTYTDTAVTPITATRTVSFSVSDGVYTSSSASRTVTVTDTDQTPMVNTSPGAASYTIGQAAVVVDGGVTVSDLDNATLASARVEIGIGLQPGDMLVPAASNPALFGNITSSYSAATGVMTITSSGATASLAQWQAFLRQIQFSTTSNVAGRRVIGFSINDGTKTSVTAAREVNVQLAVPTVTAISPSKGSVNGGTTVVITGTHFTGASAVKFGTTDAAFFNVDSGTQITATSPSGSAGVFDVTVTTAGGTSATSGVDQFTYLPLPAIASLSPASGPVAGGTVITILGTGFAQASTVLFGTKAASNVVIDPNGTQITATLPAGSSGTVNVEVTTPGGTSHAGSASQFRYVAAPVVTGLNPAQGPTAGGTSVTITGTDLADASAVKFGTTQATITAQSNTSITVTTPVGKGNVDVTVSTAGGTSTTTAQTQFKYAGVPVVTALATVRGPVAGGTSVVITGTDFTGAEAVKFGKIAATSYTVNSATQITAVTPAATAAGVVDVSVTTPEGTSATGGAAAQFKYQQNTAIVSTPNGDVLLVLSGAGCGFNGLPSHASAPTKDAPAQAQFPYGQIAFKADDCAVGGSTQVSLTLPKAMKPGSKLYKLLDGQWREWPATISGTSVQFSVTDNDGSSTASATGDSDARAGNIDDPFMLAEPAATVAIEATPVPTLAHWMLALLSLLLAGLATTGLRRTRVN